MTGVFDSLSSPDEVGFGGWRLVKNATARSTRNRRRGGGWRKLFSDEPVYNNADLHDQLTNRLSYYETFSDHAMGGGDLTGYSYAYFYGTTVIPGFDVFPPAVDLHCPVYIGDHPSGLYDGCPIFYSSVGFPYSYMPVDVSTTGLLAHWRFDEIVGGEFEDVISGLDLAVTGVSVGTGLIGNAAEFNVIQNDFLQRATSAEFEMTGNVKFGFTGWYNPQAIGVADQAILGKWDIAGSREYRIYIRNGEFRFEVTNSGISPVTVVNTTPLMAGQWYFFAAWYDPIAGTINLKINEGATESFPHASGVYGASGVPFYVGFDDAASSSNLNGRLDSVSMWKTAFPSEAELSVLYHSGMGLDYPFEMAGACNTGAPNFYQYSFVYTSCPVHYGAEVVPGYPYGPEFPVYSSQFSYDYTYCGTDLMYRLGCREAVTMLGEIVSSTGRKLIAGTMSRVYEYNQSAGNWRILADGLGNAGYTVEQCGCNSVRGSMATMGLYMLYTNGFDYPSIYVLGEMQDNCGRQDMVPISDLVALGITRAGGVVVWKGFVIFFDITEAGTRMGGTFIWSDLETPDSYIESDLSLAGRISVAVGQTILAMAPLGNWLMCYTDKGIYRITLVGGEDIFNIEEIKGVGGNALKFKYSLIVTGSAHMWLGESDVLYFTQFDTAPIHVPWITKAAGIIFNGMSEDDAEYAAINREACDLVTGGWSEEKREAWLSWPTGENTCPNVTLRFNLKFNTADLVDHGFTSYLTFRADLRPTVGEWMEDLGICPRASKIAMGPKDGPPCTAEQLAVVDPPLYIRNPEEDPDLPVHTRSLCAALIGKSMDDFCVDCAAPATFITASAEDFTLKQQEDDYYFREMLGGGYADYDAYSCTGQYYEYRGYDTVMQMGAERYRVDDEKLVKRIELEAEPLPQSTPSDLEMEVGYGSQSGCLKWKPIRSLPFECEATAEDVRPDFSFLFPTWRRGRYVSARFRISGVGGGGTFSAMTQMLKNWGQADSP